MKVNLSTIDPDNCLDHYEWQVSGGNLQVDDVSSQAIFTAPCQPGTYLLSVNALDANGKTIATQKQDIEVTEIASFPIAESYVPSGFFDDVNAITIKEAQYKDVACTEFGFSPYGKNGYGGVYWQYPPNNWGATEGKDLSGYEKVSFYVASPDKASINFIAGGVADSSLPHKDRFKKVSGFRELGPEWQKIDIDLKGSDLTSVIGALAWTTNRDNNPRPVKFYIRDIVYERYPCQ